MAISALGGVPAAANLQTNALGMEDFLKILMTQLTYQDPLKPVDNQQFMAQMAQFTALEQTQQLNTRLETLITNQAALQSIGLIGRSVEVSNDGAANLSATVTALSLAGATPALTLTTSNGAVLADVALTRIVSVR
ncbi:MAG: flagellar hook capping FlgD N-terminal domain-containing protein [Janthinobacterium lividum]